MAKDPATSRKNLQLVTDWLIELGGDNDRLTVAINKARGAPPARDANQSPQTPDDYDRIFTSINKFWPLDEEGHELLERVHKVRKVNKNTIAEYVLHSYEQEKLRKASQGGVGNPGGFIISCLRRMLGKQETPPDDDLEGLFRGNKA